MINATSISSRVKDFIEKTLDENNGMDIEGFIHSIFDYACNIQIPGGDLIGLISKHYGDNPYSISLDLPSGQTMKQLNIKQGMKVLINKKRLGSVIGSFYINIQDAISWEPSLPKTYKSFVNEDILNENIIIITKTLLDKGNFLGIGPLFIDYIGKIGLLKTLNPQKSIKDNHYSRFIAPRIKELLGGIIRNDSLLIEKLLSGIVGFGPGLTPSADDLLVGLLASLYYFQQYYNDKIHSISYIKESLNNPVLMSQTTIVSRQMLKAASQGELAKPIKELSIAMISCDDPGEIERKTIQAINLGSTSGTDTMVGLLLGIYVIKEINL